MDSAFESVVFVLFGLATVAFCAFGILGAARFILLRSKGTQLLLRRLPTKTIHGWRHGIVLYKGQTMQYYKLRSVFPGPDLIINRLDVSITGNRPMEDGEAAFMPAGASIITFKVGEVDYEMATDLHGSMAFHAWVESAPSPRLERLDPSKLRGRFKED